MTLIDLLDRVITNLCFVEKKKVLSMKHKKAKHSKTRYACIWMTNSNGIKGWEETVVKTVTRYLDCIVNLR